MGGLSISLLGPVLITLEGQPVSGFEYDKVRALLVFLVSEQDRPHRRESLAGLLWPDLPDKTAHANLRQALSKLRKAIGDQVASPRFLRITNESIQFNPSSLHWLDASVFLSDLEKVSTHRHRDVASCHTCKYWREQAIAVYRGNFLEQFSLEDSPGFEEWALVKREQLRFLALEALYHLTDYFQRRGAHSETIRYALRQLQIDPWREESCRQAMYALAASGQRNAALAQYETLRRILWDELGVEPERETQDLYGQIKEDRIREGGPAAHAQEATTFPPSFASYPNYLTPMIDRESELAEISEHLEDTRCRLLTLVGPGGIGKTRLAIQAALEVSDTFRDGVHFVPLANVTGVDQLMLSIADAVHLAITQKEDVKEQLLDLLQQREILLILDSFEHLLPGAANNLGAVQLISEMLTGTLHTYILVTSRKRLNLRAEWVFDVQGLPYPANPSVERLEDYPAIQLFNQCALQLNRAYQFLGFEANAALRICQLVEGSPLAIELAVSTLRQSSCTEIASQLESSLLGMQTSAIDVSERHRSIFAVFDHSWRLLTAEERQVFARLSVFRGGFDGEAAAQVATASARVLQSLVEQSLIRLGGVEGQNYYDMHELIRQVAFIKLSQLEAEQAAQDTHMRYFLAMAEKAEPCLFGEGQQEWLDRLDRAHDNLRAALEWSLESKNALLAGRLAGALARFWGLRGHLKEGWEWAQRVTTLLDECFPLAQVQGGSEKDASGLGESFEPFPARADDSAITIRAKTLLGSGMLAWRLGDHVQSAALMEDSLQLSRMINDLPEISRKLNTLATVVSTMGDYERAVILLEESLSLDRERGNLQGIAYNLGGLGDIAYEQGDYQRAKDLYEESLSLHRQRNDKQSCAICLNNLGMVAEQLGEHKFAIRMLEEAVSLFRDLGIKQHLAYAVVCLGGLKRSIGARRQAESLFREALALQYDLGAKGDLISTLYAIAALILQRGDFDRATCLYASAETLREAIGATVAMAQSDECEKHLAAAKAHLEEASFSAAWELGRKMTLEQVMDYVQVL